MCSFPSRCSLYGQREVAPAWIQRVAADGGWPCPHPRYTRFTVTSPGRDKDRAGLGLRDISGVSVRRAVTVGWVRGGAGRGPGRTGAPTSPRPSLSLSFCVLLALFIFSFSPHTFLLPRL